MDRHLRGIDHIVVGVRELEQAAAQWQRLGFTTTTVGRHIGWTTANICVMLEEGYIELLTGVEPAAPRHALAELLAQRGEGGLGIALATDDAAGTAAAWRRIGLEVTGPESLARRLRSDGDEIELRFRNVTPRLCELSGLACFACFHETPESLRRPEWLRHANGALRLRSCTILADPPDAVAAALTRLLGNHTVATTDNVITFHLGRQALVVAPVEDVRLFHPELAELEASPLPRLVAAEIEVLDLQTTRRVLERQGIPYSTGPDGILLDPAMTHGLAIELVAPVAAAPAHS